MIHDLRRCRSGSALLELLLGLALLALVFQLFPTIPKTVGQGLDVRYWSRSTWLTVNGAALVLLVILRQLPDWTSPAAFDKGAVSERAEDTAGANQSQLSPHYHEGKDPRVLLRQEEERRRCFRAKLALYGLGVPILVSAAALAWTRFGPAPPPVTDDWALLRYGVGGELQDEIEGVVATKFKVTGTGDLQATHLAVYDHDGKGLQLDHRVALHEVGPQGPAQRPLAETVVPYGNRGELAGGFRWASLPAPVTHKSGAEYLLLAESFQGCGDRWPLVIDEKKAASLKLDSGWNARAVDRESVELLHSPQEWFVIPTKPLPHEEKVVHGLVNLRVEEFD